jgi:formiminoglutamase/guanidinobutyrase
MMKRSKFCLIGIPDHQAVIGRLGAKDGPRAFRRAFSSLSGRFLTQEFLTDIGDVTELTPQVEENHRLAADLIRDGHLDWDGSVVVGGGHDHGFSHLLGIHEALQVRKGSPRIGCLNIDAHFDLRSSKPKITSGSPFFLAIESGILNPKRLVEFGIQSHCNAPSLWQYAEEKGINTIPFEKLRAGRAIPLFRKALKLLARKSDCVVLSLDLDAAASAFAPGVSAPQAEGFTASEVITMAEIAGEENKCISLGIFELNPVHDRDDQTSRLAATAAFHFLEKKIQKLKK